MTKKAVCLLAALLISLLSTKAPAAPKAEEPIEGHARATLISSASAIRAGRPFSIGVFLEIERGFHVYWTNPGDNGVPTTVAFKGPDGFTIVPDPFPVPRRIQQSAKEVAFGYETPVVFTAQVIPPSDIRIGDIATFSATATWLVCDKDTCTPGKADALSMALKIADHAGPANVDTFQRYGSIVYGPKEKPPEIATIQSTLDAATHTVTLTIRWKTPCTGVQVFPGADDAVHIGKITVFKTPNDETPIAIQFDIAAGQKPASNRLPMLISFRGSDGHMRGMQTSIPLK